MTIIEVSSGKEYPIEILPVEKEDFASLGKDRYFFNWREEEAREAYKLQLAGSADILGVISIERIPEEWRVHIRLLTVSAENKGNGKRYDKIAGNLIAHAAKIAVRLFGTYACVSLKPKTRLAQHYTERYQMHATGRLLSLEVPEILDLINFYDHD